MIGVPTKNLTLFIINAMFAYRFIIRKEFFVKFNKQSLSVIFFIANAMGLGLGYKGDKFILAGKHVKLNCFTSMVAASHLSDNLEDCRLVRLLSSEKIDNDIASAIRAEEFEEDYISGWYTNSKQPEDIYYSIRSNTSGNYGPEAISLYINYSLAVNSSSRYELSMEDGKKIGVPCTFYADMSHLIITKSIKELDFGNGQYQWNAGFIKVYKAGKIQLFYDMSFISNPMYVSINEIPGNRSLVADRKMLHYILNTMTSNEEFFHFSFLEEMRSYGTNVEPYLVTQLNSARYLNASLILRIVLMAQRSNLLLTIILKSCIQRVSPIKELIDRVNLA